jgi:hypothetical protein
MPCENCLFSFSVPLPNSALPENYCSVACQVAMRQEICWSDLLKAHSHRLSVSMSIKSEFTLIVPEHFDLFLSDKAITFFKGGPASRPFSTVEKSIQDSRPCWILTKIKLKFWKKLFFALVVTNIVHWRNFEITIETTINLLWPVL